MMLSLYFNCRLTNTKLTSDSIDSGYFYPVVYPKNGANNDDQYKILIRTLESYSSLIFDVAVLNIEIDEINEYQKLEIESLVKNKLSAQKKILSFTRPSTVQGWQFDAIKLSELIGENNPVLVVMNHDHPFVDYSPAPFENIVKKVFDGSGNDYGKAFYYSHAPEVMSWAINGRGSVRFNENNFLFVSSIVNDWIDSICILTPATLKSVWSKLRFSGDYIGRLDWIGAKYSNLGLTTYVSPREYFKHYDGYSHISGMRLITDISLVETCKINLPPKNLNAAVDFYYQRWVDIYLLVIRDHLKTVGSISQSLGVEFKKILERTLKLLHYAYLDEDARLGLIEKDMVGEIYSGLRNKIYFNANYLFIQVYADILISRPSVIRVIKFKLYWFYLCSLGALRGLFPR